MDRPAQVILDGLACGRSGCLCVGAARRGRGKTHCPSHDDGTPSLSVAPGRDQPVVLHCLAGCEQGVVIEEVRARGLWPRPQTQRNGAVAITRYEVRDLDGQPVAIHVRRDDGKGKRYHWERDGATGLGALHVADVPLYGAEHLSTLPDGAVVVVTEGEKAAGALRELGSPAVGTVTGAAGTPSDATLRPLLRFTVYLWPDSDSAGDGHMQRIAARLYTLGARPRVVRWPDAPPKGDGADFVAQGGTTDDVLALIAQAEPWTAPPAAGPVLVRLADVQREEVTWRWASRLPLGKLTVVAGDPGVGKSWLSLAVATAETTGAPPLPGDSDGHPPARVLILTAEDGLADTVRPRLEDMGADLDRVTALNAVRDDSGRERAFDLTADLPHLEAALSEGGYGLVIIDPINAYLGAAIDTHRDAALRSVLMPLATLAERYHVAIICVMHLTKGQRDRAIYRPQGSIAYLAAARVAWLVGQNPDNETERVLAVIKNNLAQLPPSLAFEIADGSFLWRGETTVGAAALLGPDRGTDERGALEEAVAFLSELMADGPVPTKEVEAEAREAGISSPTLRRAKDALAVRSHREQAGFGGDRGHWVWALPPQDDHHPQGNGMITLCDPESGDAPQDDHVVTTRSCAHRPLGEADTLWQRGPATWGQDTSVCRCCAGPARPDAHNVEDGRCPTCRAGLKAPERGGHLVRLALDLGGELLEAVS